MTPQLREALRDFLALAGASTGERITREAVPLRPVPRFQSLSTGASFALEYVTDWRRVVQLSWHDLERLPQAMRCMELLAADPAIAGHLEHMVGTGFWQRRLTAADLLESITVRYLDSLDGEHTETAFEALINDIDFYFSSTATRFRMIASLPGLRSDISHAALNRHISLVALTPEDREDLLPSPILTGIETVATETHALEYRWTTPKTIDGPALVDGFDPLTEQDTGRRLMSGALLALRLLKPGAIALGSSSVGPADWDPLPASLGGRLGGHGRVRGGPFVLEEPDLAEIRVLLPLVLALEESHARRLTTAARWFNTAYEQDKLEDRIVANTIALEALLGAGRGGSSYRLGLRCAFLVASNPQVAKNIHAHVTELYSVRSKLVHGSAVDTALGQIFKLTNPGAFLTDTEDLVRQAMTRFLKLMKTHDSEDAVIDVVESAVFRGLDWTANARPTERDD